MTLILLSVSWLLKLDVSFLIIEALSNRDYFIFVHFISGVHNDSLKGRNVSKGLKRRMPTFLFGDITNVMNHFFLTILYLFCTLQPLQYIVTKNCITYFLFRLTSVETYCQYTKHSQ